METEPVFILGLFSRRSGMCVRSLLLLLVPLCVCCLFGKRQSNTRDAFADARESRFVFGRSESVLKWKERW